MFNAINDPVLAFVVIALVMLLSPLFAKRLRVPDLVLLLVSGAVLGPNGLGLLERNAAMTLFGSVGMLYIMFLAGLEIDLNRFAQARGRSVAFGLLTFAVPQGVGTLVGFYVLGMNLPASLLLASMFASHTLLAYPIASRLGLARTEPVAVTVGATILTDTLALLVLAVIADLHRGVTLGPAFWFGIGGGMAALVALTWLGIPRVTRWFFENVAEAGGAQFLFVLVVVCGCSYLSHFAKLEPIIGAFLAGAAFNRLIPAQSVLMNRVVFAGNTLFIPFFLLSVGMLVDVRAFGGSPRGLLVGAAMVVTVVATKHAAAWIAGACFGYDRDARHLMFGLSVVQAAATLAAVLVGHQIGIFDDAVLNGAIAMIVVTCPMGAAVVERHGRALAGRAAVPVVPTAQPVQRILVAVASPAFASRLMDLAFLLHERDASNSIHAITIIRDEADADEAVAIGERLLASCLSRAAAADLPVQSFLRVDINVSDGLSRVAKELRATIALVGWERAPTVSSRLFGSGVKQLLETCPSRLMFCRLVKPMNTASRLLVLFGPLAENRPDISPLVRDAKRLARQIGAQMRVHLAARASEPFRRLLASELPACPLTIHESTSLSEAGRNLAADIREGDVVLFASERRADARWAPTLDRISAMIVQTHPEVNVLIAYPPPPGFREAGPLDEPVPVGPTCFRAVSATFAPEEGLSGALAAFTAAAFPGDAPRQEQTQKLLAASAASPTELAPGVVLLHVHCPGIDEAVVAVGSGHVHFPESAMEAEVVLGLFAPREQSAERHLLCLAELARRFNDAHIAARAAAGAPAEELCRLLVSNGPSRNK